MTPKFGSSKQSKPSMTPKAPGADQGKGLVKKQSSASKIPSKESKLGKPLMGDINEPFEEALEDVNNQLAQDPQNPELHKRKLQILRKQEDVLAIQTALEEAMQACPSVFFATKLADTLEGRGLYKKAQPLRQWCVDRQPDDVDSVRRLALTASRAYDLEVAERYYSKLIEMRAQEESPLSGSFFEEMLGKGLKPEQRSALQQMGLRLVAKALINHESNPDLLETAARLAYRTKSFKESRGAYEQAIRTNPNHKNAKIWKMELLRVYAHLGLQKQWHKLSESFIEELKEELQKDRTDNRVWNMLATQQIQAGYFDDAIRTLKDALIADSRNTQALWNLGNLYVRCGAAQDAIGYYQDIIDDPNEKKAVRRAIEKALAGLYFKLGMYDESLNIYLRDEENNAQFIAPILEATGRQEEAEETYLRSVSKSPRDAKCHLGLAEYWVRHANWEKAIEAAQNGLACNYATEEVHTNLSVALATAYMKLKEFDKAMQSMDEICELYPDSIHCMFRKVKLLILQKRSKEAIALAEEICDSAEMQTGCAPASSVLWSLLGDVSFLLRRFDKAKHAYNEAIKYDAMNSVAVCGLGMLESKLGNNVQAYKLYNKFITLDPLSLAVPTIKATMENMAAKMTPQELEDAENDSFFQIQTEDTASDYLGLAPTTSQRPRIFPGLPGGLPVKSEDKKVDKSGWLGDGSPIDYGY
ncbi:tetratricopeptide repeat protein [bacterium]|nr:tetratricopeptide repeat protein [bacterium]